MVIGAARDDAIAALLQLSTHGARIDYNLVLVIFELRLQGLEEGDRLSCDHMHQRTTLRAREDQRVEFFGQLVVLARENQTAARTAQRLVGRGGHDIRIRNGVRINARCDETGHVRHVDVQIGTHLVGDRAKTREVEQARIGRKASDDELRLDLECLRFESVVVDLAVIGTDAVLRGVEDLAREVHLRAVRKVTAMIETHTEDGITRLEHGEIDGRVGLRTGVRLHVGVVGAEELLGSIDR